jgi:hypothetical protein
MNVVVFVLILLNALFSRNCWVTRHGNPVSPSGHAALVLLAMVLMGQLSCRAFDTRLLIGRAFALLAYGLWSMSDWTLAVSITSVRFAMVITGRGFILPRYRWRPWSCVEKDLTS